MFYKVSHEKRMPNRDNFSRILREDFTMTKKQIKQLETAGRKLEKCGGDCRYCDKCHIYTRWTERAGYMAVGCDLLPSELYDYIASVPSQLHSAAMELVKFELS